MGCASSADVSAREAAKAKMLSLQIGELDRHGTLDVRTLTMLMWKARDSPELMEVLSDLIAAQSDEKEVFDGVEFYLPQIAHMVIHLEANVTTSTLEAFALLVSQLSIHFALQLYWILVAAMEDYQPEGHDGLRNPTANPELYIRCATLLHKVEQSVVFGSPRCPEFEALFAAGKLTKDELHEIELADRRFMAAQIAEAEVTDEALTGVLGYKRWKKTSRFQRKQWQQRYFKVQYRVLLCYRVRDMTLKRAIPLQHVKVEVKPHRVHKYYFEITELQRERVYKLYAQSRAEMDKWVSTLRQEAAAPPSYAPTDFDTTTLSPAQIARYGFFRSEREFIRQLTDICEELRFVEVPERKVELEKKLQALSIPGCVYLPLIKSTDTWKRVIDIRDKEGHPFSTRARCPCLLTFEVATENPEELDVANYLYQTLGLGMSITEAAEVNQDGEENIEEIAEGEQDSNVWRKNFINSARLSVSNLNSMDSLNSTKFHSAVSQLDHVEEIEELAPEDVTIEEVAAAAANHSTEAHAETDDMDTDKKRNKRRFSFDGPSQNLGASTRKIVQSAKGAALNAKKGATQAVDRVKEVVHKKTDSMSHVNARPSIWDRKSSRSLDANKSNDNLVDRKTAKQNMNKKRAINLIHSKSGGDSQGESTEESTKTSTMTRYRSASSDTERPFLSSLGKLASVPRKRRNSLAQHSKDRELADHATGEPVDELKDRIRTESMIANTVKGWDILRVIAKSNDDLRQEVFVMQLIEFLHDIWLDAGLGLYLHPYRILSTSKDCGMLEVVGDASSLDGVKSKTGPDVTLMQHFIAQHGIDTPKLRQAQRNFMASMAGYSVTTYILGIKDRHNGNIMLDNNGHVVHIDFGFAFGMAPGKDKIPHTDFSMERAAFKITGEMVEVIGGTTSILWEEFEQLIVDGLLECRKHHDTLITLVEIMGFKSNYPCFNQPGGGVNRVIRELKEKLMLKLTDKQAEKKMRKLIKSSVNHTGTILYEKFQRWSNGIEPIF